MLKIFFLKLVTPIHNIFHVFFVASFTYYLSLKLIFSSFFSFRLIFYISTYLMWNHQRFLVLDTNLISLQVPTLFSTQQNKAYPLKQFLFGKKITILSSIYPCQVKKKPNECIMSTYVKHHSHSDLSILIHLPLADAYCCYCFWPPSIVIKRGMCARQSILFTCVP